LDNHINIPATILELDQEQTFQSQFIDYNQKLNSLTPPVTSHRIRQDSSGSSTNSLKYTQ
jgi:hypothetical protein